MKQNFAETLDSLLRRDSRTAATIAEEAGIGAPYLSQLRKGGKAKPGMDVIVRLAKTLHVPVTAFTESNVPDAGKFAETESSDLQAAWPDQPQTTEVLADAISLLGAGNAKVLLDRMFEKSKSDHEYYLRNTNAIELLVSYLKTNPD